MRTALCITVTAVCAYRDVDLSVGSQTVRSVVMSYSVKCHFFLLHAEREHGDGLDARQAKRLLKNTYKKGGMFLSKSGSLHTAFC